VHVCEWMKNLCKLCLPKVVCVHVSVCVRERLRGGRVIVYVCVKNVCVHV